MKSKKLNDAWNEVKGMVLEEWDKLTEDDLARKAKSHRQLINLISSTYGISRTQAKREIKEFVKKYPVISKYFETMTRQTNLLKGKTCELVMNSKKITEKLIKERPLISLTLAFVTGFFLGLITKSK